MPSTAKLPPLQAETWNTDYQVGHQHQVSSKAGNTTSGLHATLTEPLGHLMAFRWEYGLWNSFSDLKTGHNVLEAL